ncbi:phage antirepressor KilAC domain-containing protein [Acinetobacter baumannii]|uniref:phage antirepressor KilAC domain-containing protein n=1 Tax=Acinetobacter TaxID=469 RepID=UPI000A35AD81|nr:MULTISPECIES: phage antirepressor KilAC domain-containing protein [Acinetobacter]HAV4234127.1 DNA-binding protein [Acinetobacter baumannii ATCC 17978]MBJ8460513.1 phage antirepressor KilAC domain-containing protein [Acinetobacter nosocomialis]MBJ9959893.1 phage antirepressor KilAC domain-containing protein [Acinetobacter nosocomialis]MBV6768394.1 phage antirepressor KilAC domain-containing protein [Acinetobacter baumannii]MDN8336196.1 phage antirepressor KilAC domain-containing protein [Aci
MNMMTQFNHNQQSMTSLDISELCQKRHDNVKRLIENLINQQVIACPQIEVVQKEANSRAYNVEVYVFTGEQGKLDSITVVAQLCPEFTAALVKRWYELENQNAVQLPQTFAEALQLAADQARQLELAAPKVQYFDRVADTKNLLNASQVGKKVGMSAVKLNQYLADMGVYDRRIAGRTFAQWFIDKGYGEVKQTEQGYPQSKFTNKGEQWVIEQLVSEGVVQ